MSKKSYTIHYFLQNIIIIIIITTGSTALGGPWPPLLQNMYM